MPELPVAKAYAAAPATGRANQRAPEVFLGPRPCAESTTSANRSATSISPSENLLRSATFLALSSSQFARICPTFETAKPGSIGGAADFAAALLLGKEAKEENGEDGEEDARLLHRHRYAGDLLVGLRREAPEASAVDLPVVRRLRQQSHEQADWACKDERDEDVERTRRTRKAVRQILEHRPPEEQPGGEVADVLEVEERVALEGGVVESGDMPQEVRRQPQAECDGRAREESRAGEAGEVSRHRRRDAQDEERRRPLGEHDVLKKVSGEEVVGERVERGDGGDEEEQTAGGEGRHAPALRARPASPQRVDEDDRGDAERRLRVRGPCVRVRAGDRRYASPTSRPW